MKIVIPGGSGQVGTILARAFHVTGDEVVVLSRRPEAQPWRVVAWDGVTPGARQREIEGCHALINLAGRSVNCRHNRVIGGRSRTRVLSTRAIAQAIAGAAGRRECGSRRARPRSTRTGTTRRDAEHSGILGGDEPDAPDSWRFSIDVARAWEREFDLAVCGNTRKIALRSAMTLSPTRRGVRYAPWPGAVRARRKGGDGRQFISWIHEADFVAAVRWLIDHEDIDGVVNVAAPNPVLNTEFMRELRRAGGIPFGFPSTTWMLELAFFMRTETELILKSRRVIPGRWSTVSPSVTRCVRRARSVRPVVSAPRRHHLRRETGMPSVGR